MAQTAGASQSVGSEADPGTGQKRPLTPLVEVSPREAFKVVLIDCLAKLHTGGMRPEWDASIERAWRHETGTEYLALNTVPSAALWGPPGHGKSTICKLVGRTIAGHLGLQFVLNPPNDLVVTDKHFLVTTQEMSESVSNVDFAGIPAKAVGRRPDGNTFEYMEKLLERRIVQLRYAAAGILLLDDFTNASQSVQNNILSIVEEARFQGLDLGPRVMPILTANLDGVDGTHTGRPSTATMTRVRNLFVYETVEEFAARTQLAFRDLPYGDLGLSEHLKRNSVYYDTLDPSGPAAPHACPRSLTKVIDSMRLVRHLYEPGQGRAGPDNPNIGLSVRRMLEIYAKGLVGEKAGAALVSYAYSLLTEAEPLAVEAMSRAGLSAQGLQRLKAKIGDGQAAEAQTFAYQFACAVAHRAADLIVRSQTLAFAAVRFAQAVLAPRFIPDTTRTLALSRLARQLIERSPNLANPKHKEVLRTEFAQGLARALTVVELDDYFVRQTIPDVLSGYVSTPSYATGQWMNMTNRTPRTSQS